MKRTEQERAMQSPNFEAEQQETIRRRAFQIYQQRGMADGHELDDWLRAEAEINSQPTQKAA